MIQTSVCRCSENTYSCIKALSSYPINLLNGVFQYFTCEAKNTINNQCSSTTEKQCIPLHNEIVASCVVTTGEKSELQCSTARQVLHSSKNVSSYRSISKEKAESEMDKKLREQENSSHLQQATKSIAKGVGKYLPPAAEMAKIQNPVSLPEQDLTTEATSYTTSTLLGATGSHARQYATSFDKHQPPPEEERRKHKSIDHQDDSTLYGQSHPQILKNQLTSTSKLLPQQHKTTLFDKQSSKPTASLTPNKPKGTFPRRACLVYNNDQYPLDRHLLSQPLATKYLVKVRTEISPGCFMAKLDLHCAR